MTVKSSKAGTGAGKRELGSGGWAAIKIGEMGELLFAAWAVALGLTVAKPYGAAEAFDLVVWNRETWVRVQLKAMTRLFRKDAYNLRCGRREYRGQHAKRKTHPYTKEDVDFVAAYLGLHKVWYILPVEAIGERVNIYLSEGPRARKENPWWQYREKWELLLAPGKTVEVDLMAGAEEWEWVMSPGRRGVVRG